MPSSLRTGLSQAQDAQAHDLPSLTTMHKRIFHPNNTFQRQAIPDTPLTREWWHASHARAIADPASQVLIVRDANSNSNSNDSSSAPVIAVLRSKRFETGETGAGLWDSGPLTDDHDADLCRSFIEPMVEYRERLIAGRPHYLIELFGTDSEYQGSGAGSALLGRCCEIADADGLEVFVEANANAVPFYERYGFETKQELVLPGELKYRECMLVRPRKR